MVVQVLFIYSLGKKMLDFNHILNNPNLNVQTFIGTAQTTAGVGTGEWKTWIKPRGAKFVYMIGVGGGASGGCGINTSTSSGGGAGGGSGAQSTLFIPASFLPDVLYIQAGLGGSQPATLVSGAIGVAGTITYVAIEPWTTLSAQTAILFANAGAVTGTAATTTNGGVAGTAAAVATIANMPLAGRGFYQFFAGQSGVAGGTSSGSVTNLSYPTTGIMVTGGSGGGGSSATVGLISGRFTGSGLGDNFPTSIGSPGGSGATPAGKGSGGFMLKSFQYMGGTGGGGASGNNSAGVAGAGGNGAPGCGGGGAGGSNTTASTLARPGDGGPGFVYILSW